MNSSISPSMLRLSALSASACAFLLATACGGVIDPNSRAAAETPALAAVSAAAVSAVPLTSQGQAEQMSTDVKTTGLITSEHMIYQGAFALPEGTIGTSRFGYGGNALTPYRDPQTGKLTLYMQGHVHFEGQVAQVEVPSGFVKSVNRTDLPLAKILQPFSDITDGELARRPNSLGNAANGSPVYGLLPYNGRLIVAATMYYDATQNASHGVSALDLSRPGDFKGFFPFASNVVAPPRALGGAMAVVPAEWRAKLGGPAITGNQSVPLIGATSAGPALTVFDPDAVGSTSPIPGQTLLFYPLSNPLCGPLECESNKNSIYNQTSVIRGAALVSQSGSVLFIGKHGVGEYWYGGTTSPEGYIAAPGSDGYGPKSTRFEYRVWAYKVDDLVAVKNALKKPWELRPYSIFALPEVSGLNPGANLRGVGYDDESGLLFIAPDFGEQGRIEVYKVNKPL